MDEVRNAGPRSSEQTAGWSPIQPEMNREDAIRWLVQFASADIGALGHGRPGDLANLLYDLRRFVSIVAPGPIEDEIRRAEKDPTVLKPAIDVARRLVETAESGKPGAFDYQRGKIILNAAGRGYSHLAMPLEDAILFSALDYDIDANNIGDQIKRCRECKRVFAASRKDAIYCDRQCANMAAVRAYRERHTPASLGATKRARPKRRTK